MPSKCTYTIRKDASGDYVVRFRLNGIRLASADYFTPCPADAIATALIVADSINQANK